jgi:CubicO group peptidase (beta-lactamase class C family)
VSNRVLSASAVGRRLVIAAASSMAAAGMTTAMTTGAARAQGTVRAQGAQPVSLDAELSPYLARYSLPALAAAVVKDGKVVAAGATGTRRAGTNIPVTLQDRFHNGSTTKALTATLAAILVEDGKLRWNTTVGEIYPELVGKMSAGVKDITLEQLLSHSSGIPGENKDNIALLSYAFTDDDDNLDGMRVSLVERLVKMKLATPPGKTFEYSNLGYTLAGSMMEKVTGKTWEELVVDRIFEPLGLRSAGFGPQSSLGKIDAPVGHTLGDDGKFQAFLAGPFGDNPLVIGPAGTAHMSVLDFATWAAWNAAEGRQGPKLLKPETVAKLHTKIMDVPRKPNAPVGTPESGGYGLGWRVAVLPFSPEPFIYHGGSNNMNLCYILVRPKKQLGMVVMTNVGGPKANEGLLALVEQLYKKFG